jgi:hypothetical protein
MERSRCIIGVDSKVEPEHLGLQQRNHSDFMAISMAIFLWLYFHGYFQTFSLIFAGFPLIFHGSSMDFRVGFQGDLAPVVAEELKEVGTYISFSRCQGLWDEASYL